MKKVMSICVLFALLLSAVSAAMAHTVTFTWTWPTTRADGTALPLTSIGGATVYDTTLPAPGLPGTAVTCPVTPLPPTAATGTCTTSAIAAGNHNYVVVITDNASPPDASAVSNAVSVTVPLSGPAAVSNLAFTLN